MPCSPILCCGTPSYYPIITRIQRLLASPLFSKLLRYPEWRTTPADGAIEDVMDGSIWRRFELTLGPPASDHLPLALGLSTDGVVLVKNVSSMWPITACVFNLPPW